MKNQIVNRGSLFSLAAVLLMLFALHGASYGQTTVSVTPASIDSPDVGGQFNIAIAITGGVNVGGYQFDLIYDSSALKLVAMANADYLPAGAFATPLSPELAKAQGRVSLGAVSVGAASDGDGTLATATFEVIEVKDSSITLENTLISDAAAAAITHTTAGSAVSVPTAPEAPADDTTGDDTTADDTTADDTTGDDTTADDTTADDTTADDTTADDTTADDTTADDTTADDTTGDDTTADDTTADDTTADDTTADDTTADDTTADDTTADDTTADDTTADDTTADDTTADDTTADDTTADDTTADDTTADDTTADDTTGDDTTADDTTADDTTADDTTADDTTADDTTADDTTADDTTADDTTADDTTADDTTADDTTADDTTTDDTTADDTTADDTTADDTTADDTTADDTTADDTTADDTTADDTTADDTTAEPADEMAAFAMTLDMGLNMISLPLMPAEPYTAQTFAEAVGATVVIRLDTASQKFIGFTAGEGGAGFAIEGGQGYIVNTPAGGAVTFMGTAWDNQQVATAPGINPFRDAWAFVVSGSLQNADPHTSYTLGSQEPAHRRDCNRTHLSDPNTFRCCVGRS